MKRLKISLPLVCAVITLHAGDSTNKTFFSPRSEGVNLPARMVPSGAWVRQPKGRASASYLNITGLYQASADAEAQARYFLCDNKNSLLLRNEAAHGDAKPLALGEFGIRDLIHDAANTIAYDTNVQLRLKPERQAWGMRFDYHQDLSMILHGLFAQITIPMVHLEHKMNLTTSASGHEIGAHVTGTTQSADAVIRGYLMGEFANNVPTNRSVALTQAVIKPYQTDSGIADIDVRIGHRFNNTRCHLVAAFGLSIPTGSAVDGKTLFQPIVGNGQHIGVGGDIAVSTQAWHFGDHTLRISADMRLRFLLQNRETRTLGFASADNTGTYNFGHYTLIQEDGAQAGAALIPAANILTRRFKVTPRTQLDAVLRASYTAIDWSFDLGYNLFAREREFVRLKDDFGDKQYAVPDYSFRTTQSFSLARAADVWHVINRDTISVLPATSERQMTHGIFGSASYIFPSMRKPILFSLGGKYEFAVNNNALEQWSLWHKIGIGF